MKLYAIHDKRAETYYNVMAMPTDAHAVRSFTQEVNREAPENMLNQYPDDFQIVKVGTFDEETGEITPEHTMLMEASAAKRPAQPDQKRA
ncbi:MAG: nonstructural protein [Arizlama microvirus]|nr:MAG: nonstructural protein [Arizlama microvirus]